MPCTSGCQKPKTLDPLAVSGTHEPSHVSAGENSGPLKRSKKHS